MHAFISSAIKTTERVDRTEPIQFGFTKASKFTILIFIHEGPKFKDHLGLYLTEIVLTSKLSIAKNELISDSKQVLLLGSMKSMKLVIRLHFILGQTFFILWFTDPPTLFSKN